MSKDDLERIREDVATLKLALAPDLPFKPTTVRFALALSLGGVLSLLWALYPLPVPPKWSGAVPALLQLIPILATLVHFAIARPDGGCSVTAGEIKRAHLNYVPYIVAMLALPFLILSSRIGWIPVAFISPSFLFLFGAVITGVALTERGHRFNLGLGIPMVLCAAVGLVLKWPHALLLGVTFAIGGMASALTMMVQLRRRSDSHATH